MTKVAFVSYSNLDGASTAVVAQEIRARGILTWQDIESIRAGKKIEAEIALGIERSDAVLSILTPASVESEPVYTLEIMPVLEQRRRGRDKDLIVAARNLGERQDIAETTKRRYGEDLTTTWLPIIPAGTETLTPDEASPIASALLTHFFAAGRGVGGDELRIGLHSRGFTPGTRDLELDWTSIFDVERRSRGTPEQWARVWRALRDVQRALANYGPQRRVLFDGQAHLTAGLLVGIAFSRNSGFQVGVLSAGARWDQGGSADSAGVTITKDSGPLNATNIAIELGLAREVTARVSEHYASVGAAPRLRLLVAPSAPADRWIQPENAGGLAQHLGRCIRDAVDKTHTRQVDIFYAGPLTLAILLGAELGSVEASLQLFEYEGGTYHASIRIPQDER